MYPSDGYIHILPWRMEQGQVTCDRPNDLHGGGEGVYDIIEKAQKDPHKWPWQEAKRAALLVNFLSMFAFPFSHLDPYSSLNVYTFFHDILLPASSFLPRFILAKKHFMLSAEWL